MGVKAHAKTHCLATVVFGGGERHDPKMACDLRSLRSRDSNHRSRDSKLLVNKIAQGESVLKQ